MSPTSSPPDNGRAVLGGQPLDLADDPVKRRRGDVDQVHRDLRAAGAREPEPERLHARKAAVARPDRRGDRAGHLDVARVELEVERDERRAHAEEDGARGRMELRRAEERLDLARTRAGRRERRRLPCGRTPGGGRRRGRRTRAPGCRAPRRAPRGDGPRARARRRRPGSGRTGTTSAAPTRGCTPSCRRRSIRSAATAIAAARPSTRSAAVPMQVKTERLWSASACTSSTRACAASGVPDGVERRGVATLGEIGNRLEEAAHPAHSIRHAKRLERASGWRPAGGDITAFGGERGYKVWPRR